MAKPTALTEAGGSKIVILADKTATTPAAKAPVAVRGATSGESTYPVAWQGAATHRDADTFNQPGGFTDTTDGGPVMAIAAKVGTTANALVGIASTPAGTEIGLITRNIPSGTQPVSGTVTITPSGTQTVTGTVAVSTVTTVTTVSTVTAVTAITNALPTGTNTVGGTLATGWNFGALGQQRGRISLNSTSETTVLAALSGNFYSVTDIVVSHDGGAVCTLTFRHNTAGTTFMVLRLGTTPTTVHIPFVMPDKGQATNIPVTAQCSSATPNIEILVHAYGTTT